MATLRTNLPRIFRPIDKAITGFFRRYGVIATRLALAVIFILFGGLKVLGISPAEQLVLETVTWVPLIPPRTMYYLIGWWEMAIGACFLWRPLLRGAIALLALQMVGTFLPLVILPGTCYQRATTFDGAVDVWTLTTEAQYILKNLVIIAGAMVLGGTVRTGPREDLEL